MPRKRTNFYVCMYCMKYINLIASYYFYKSKMKVLKEGPAYNTKVWHSLICQVHVLLQIRKAKWLLKSASASSASLKLKEWKPKCSTYTLKVPFPLVLWLYFQMLFFGYIRLAWNWIFRTSLLYSSCSSMAKSILLTYLPTFIHQK